MSGGPMGVGIRLFMAGGELIKQTFSQIGDAGRRMWAAIASGEKTANPALKGLSAASREAQDSMSGLAANAGSAGRILMSMGPAGFAAAAGIGALVIGLGKAAEAIRDLDALGDTATKLDIGVETLVRYREALRDAGGEAESFTAGVESWQLRVGQYFAGLTEETSAFGKALKEIGVTRAELAAAETLQQQLGLIAEGLSRIDDVAERTAIADKLGLRELLPLLSRGRDGMEKLADENSELAKRQAEAAAEAGPLADRIEKADAQIKAAADSLSVRLGPALTKAREAFASFLQFLATDTPWDEAIKQRAVERSAESVIARLRVQISELKTQANAERARGGGFGEANADEMEREAAALSERVKFYEQLQRMQSLAGTAAKIAARGASRPTHAGAPEIEGDVSGDIEGLEDRLKAGAEAAKLAAREFEAATRLLDSAVEKARGPLGAYLADLDGLAKASATLPGRQDDVRIAVLAASRSYLEAAAGAADFDEGLAALEARDPAALDAYAARLADLVAQRDAYPGGSEAFQAALDAETRAFLEAAQGAGRAVEARKAFDALWDSLATDGERAAKQRADGVRTVNRALAEGEITADQAGEALRRLNERFDDLGGSQIRAAEAGEGWMTVLDGLTGGAENFEQAIVSLIGRLIELTMLDFFKGENKGDFWGSIGGALGDLFGFGGGGGGGGIGGSGINFGDFWHGGGGPGDMPAFSRTLPASVWDDAPRHHEGWLARNERAAIIEDDESVLTPGQLGALYRMGLGHGRADGGGASETGLLITLRNESGGRLETEQREGSDGPELDILVRDAVSGAINSGGLDAPMRNRFGLTPKPT